MNLKVIKIVNEYLIVVNYGKEHHAETGDILEIFQVGDEIYDPDTNEFMGTLDVTKGQIKVKNVYEKMSLCESNEFTKILPETTQKFSATMLAISKSIYPSMERKALPVNTQQITGGYNENNKGFINISEPVRVIKSKYWDETSEEDDDTIEENE